MMNITVLGSTGSIGTQALSILENDPEVRVSGLCCMSNIEKMEEQAVKFRPSVVCVYDEKKARELETRLSARDIRTKVLSGMEGLEELAALPEADTVLVSVVGMIGIRPTLAAIRAGKRICLANKETLVCAGHIIMPLVKEKKVRLLPVDSEHSAIFQCLQGEEGNSVSRLLITASGGPFRGKTREELEKVTAADALRHPNWSMGAKITIDSSTLVNKALEVMEAHWLFGVPYEKIEVVVQPKSVIHSMVEFEDGAVKAQLGVPSMLVPIAYALYYPKRIRLPEERLDFSAMSGIELGTADTAVFRGLSLGMEAGRTGGTLPTVFNAANEEAVALFLKGRITWLSIAEGIEAAMRHHIVKAEASLGDIFEAEAEARSFIRGYFGV